MFVIPSGEMSNFLLKDYDAVWKSINTETQKKKVNKGFLVYTRSSNKLVEAEISESAKQDIRLVCQEVNGVII